MSRNAFIPQTIPRLTTNLLIGLKVLALFAILFYRYPLYLLTILIILVSISVTGEIISSYAIKRHKRHLASVIYTILVLVDAFTFAAALIIFNLVATDFYLLGLISLIVIPFRGGMWVGSLSGVLISFFYLAVAYGKISTLDLVVRTASLLSVCLVSGSWGEILQQEFREKAKLQSQNRRLKEITRLKNEFASVATHNLRAPLTSLKGYWEALSEEDLPPKEQVQFLNQMRSVLANLEKLIDELLEITKIKAISARLPRRRLNPLPIIQEIHDSMKPAAVVKKLGFVYQNEVSVPLRVEVNARMFKNALSNLVDNAIKYTQKGSVTIRVWLESTNLLIAVSDTGLGIPKDDQEKVFKPFYRGKSETAERYKGTGLGLYIVKKFVKANKGSVKLESEEGKGTTFTLCFPVQIQAEFLQAF
ncbi:HAMP domain-containing histidine kinase [Patescibacteria group bacterium]|nr:HAMP domain-containing histidine kinase [Patescibacteria group bacterium]MBU1868332.1 HAMP domain-containing histidine kinase [Patescibacteria group bacterium]